MRPSLLALIFLFAAPALAQEAPADSACTYRTCALRVEPGLFGRRLVRGDEGALAAEPRFVGLGPLPLSEVVAGSPAALAHARVYERSYRNAALLAAAAGALLFFALDHDNFVSDEVQVGAAVGATGLLLTGLPLELRSQRALSRAIWEYNAELPR